MRILFQLLIDFDLHRTNGTEVEPLLFEIQGALEDMLDELDPDTEEIAEQIRLAAIASAMLIADRGESEVVDIEVDDAPHGGPANDD
ncbi:hypothetical protein [Caulobacter sp. 602-1]|uniref:hypothetical protein n=1 Tax=Caulobacter sp. 602-1 TaxID=2492472 RepID=UPI000F62CBE8|nr:hypothetical protein [Caulobacter sp. 602-1]RRN64666.1 hypothetical protein EIK80_11565 [Caulobacter sp. 602-1]